MLQQSIKVGSTFGIEDLLAREKYVANIQAPDKKRGILNRHMVMFRRSSVILKTNKVGEKHEAKDESKKASFLHNLKGIGKVRSILKNSSEVNLKLEKTIDIPG